MIKITVEIDGEPVSRTIPEIGEMILTREYIPNIMKSNQNIKTKEEAMILFVDEIIKTAIRQTSQLW